MEDRLKGIEFVVIPTIKKKEEVYERAFFLNTQLLLKVLPMPWSDGDKLDNLQIFS